TLSAAILGSDGQELGIVEGTLRLGRFLRFADHFPTVPSLRLQVLDGARRVILSTLPDPASEFGPANDEPPETPSSGPARIFVAPRAVVDGIERPARLTSRTFTASRLLRDPWTILAQQDIAAIRAAARRQLLVLAACLALVVAGLLASSGFLASHLTEPLERLVRWSRDLATENVSVCHLPPRTSIAEITDLRDHLRAMAARLQLAYGDLQRAQEVLLEAHDQLEARVADRTRKLRETISVLREEAEERSRALSALEEANLRLRESSRDAQRIAREAADASLAKSRFLAATSVEIRTPLTAIVGLAHLLLDSSPPPDQRDYVALIRDRGVALLALLDDIIDLSNIATSRLRLEPAEFDLVPLVEDVAAAFAPRAHEKGLELVCAIDPGVPPRLVGDAGRVRQILTHLAGNAVKFTDQGSVQIRVHLAHASEGTATLRFTFADTGVGIPLDALPTLFTPFTSAGAATVRRQGGTGLGLAISKELAGLMHGSLGVESDPGRGSTFWVILPLQLPTPPSDPPAVVASHPDPGLEGIRVLVVDPFPASRVATTTLLHSWGCDTDFAADTHSALLVLTSPPNQKGFDVVLVDQSTPGVASGEFARSIRARPELRTVRFILMTRHGSGIETASTPGQGHPAIQEKFFVQWIPKPVRQATLRAAVGRADAQSQDPSEHPGLAKS
ncbi:MAG: hybrid sensor histidine kinase/response regulator, partial [Limisphaerales bacterium]